MTGEIAIRENSESETSIGQDDSDLENVDDSPEKYVELKYSDHRNPEYIRITATNHHPDKNINPFFYTLKEDGSGFIPGSWPNRTIKARLRPSETTLVHFSEKKHNPRLFLFNAIFVDRE